MDGTEQTSDCHSHYPSGLPFDLTAIPSCLPQTYPQSTPVMQLTHSQPPSPPEVPGNVTSDNQASAGPEINLFGNTRSAAGQLQLCKHRPQHRKHYGRRASSKLAVEETDCNQGDGFDYGQDDSFHVELDDKADIVWHSNHDETSYSRSFADDEEGDFLWQAKLALAGLKRRQQKEHLLNEHASECPDAEGGANEQQWVASYSDDEAEARWKSDLLLRNIMRHTKQALRNGAMIALERMGPINATFTCMHPHCPAPSQLILPTAYYLIVGDPRQLQKARMFCLACLEALWSGEGLCGELPQPTVLEMEWTKQPAFGAPHLAVQPATSLTLDGAMDVPRLESAGLDASAYSITTPSTSRTSPVSSQSLHADLTPGTEVSDHACGHGITHGQATDVLQSPLAQKKVRDLLDTASRESKIQGDFSKPSQSDTSSKTKIRATIRRSARLRTSANKHVSASIITASAASHDSVKNSTPKAAKSPAAESIAREISKAEVRLELMYDQRAKLLKSLTPGERAHVTAPRCSKASAGKYQVGVDMFGVAFTDLLAEPVKYWMQHPLSEKGKAEKACSDPLLGPVPGQLCSAVNQRGKYEQRWCSCYGPDGEREMVQCGNDGCLRGWYHSDCLGGEQVARDGWHCKLCQAARGQGEILSYTVTSGTDVAKLFAPTYAKAIGPETNGWLVERLHENHQIDEHSIARSAFAASNYTQLDGPAEIASLHNQPSKPSPRREVFNLPRFEQADNDKHMIDPSLPRLMRISPTPATDTPKTPGSPHSSEDSTFGNGQWRKPVARFQYLANFIKPSNSLNEKDKAVIQVWKLASEEQLKWQEHLYRHDMLWEHYRGAFQRDETVEEHENAMSVVVGPSADDGGLEDGEIVQDSFGKGLAGDLRGGRSFKDANKKTSDQQNEEALTEKAGVWKRECRGRSISAVLELAQSRNGD